jgi:hypothetical protein
MKRLAILAILAAFILGTVATASAVELKARGSWRVHANWMDNYDFDDDDPVSEDDFAVYQRARVWFDFVANENLKAVLGLEIGDVRWGDGAGAIGTDQRAIEVKHAYLDFNLPDTEVNIKAGLQWIELPSSFGSNIVSKDMAALVVNVPFNDMIGLTVGWARPVDKYTDDTTYSNYYLNATTGVIEENASTKKEDDLNDEVDVIFLSLPVKGDGFAVTPFYATALIGKDSGLARAGDDESPWWAGLNVKLDMMDPIVILADLDYGRWDTDDDTKDRAGWYFDLAVDYKMDMMTPEVFFVYSTGEDGDNDGSELMPTLYTEVYGPTTFGFAGSSFGKADGIIGYKGTPAGVNIDLTKDAGLGIGLWALGFKLKDMSFMEDLKHDFILMYAKGTNDQVRVDEFTEKDSLWEVDFNTKYQMYENLAAIVELGYVKVNLSDDEMANRDELLDEAAWKMAVGFKYDF